MKNRTLVLAFVLIAGISLTTAFFYKDFFKTQPVRGYHNKITVDDRYNADQEIAQALEQLQQSQEKASIVTGDKSRVRQIALTFDGLTDRTTIQQIVALLNKYNVKATFFADGVQTVEEPQALQDIQNAGQKIGNYTLLGMAKLEDVPVDRLVKDFCRAKKIIQANAAQDTNLLKCNDTKYTDKVLQVAKACGFKNVVQSDVVLNAKQIQTTASADVFVATLRPGSIVSVRLKTNMEALANEKGKTAVKPAMDKQPGLKEMSQSANPEEKEIVGAVERLLLALQKAKYTTVYVEDFAKSNTKTVLSSDHGHNFAVLAQAASFLQEQIMSLFSCRTAYAAELADTGAREIKMISTTEPALAYTFGGLSNKAVVDDVLGKLNALGIKATFFVAETEMRKYPETVRKIIAAGHEIGIALVPKNGETLDEICQDITRSRNKLQEQFGVTTNLVKQPWGAITDTTREAVATAGCELIGQSINVIQSKHKDYTSAEQVVAEVFGKANLALARGQIIHFRMDFYTNERVVVDLLELIKQRKVDNIAYAPFFDNPAHNPDNNSQYTIKPVGEILYNTKFIYQYPADPVNIPVQLRNNGQGLKSNTHNFLNEVAKRYIGNEDVTYETSMLGFSKMDARRLDTKGFVHTEDNVIFLTFDDWGTDASINKILYVLRKHHVPGTFFIITHNVAHNPNLLRTIAMEGHDIGCHSDLHKPMTVRDPKTGKLFASQDKAEYAGELAAANQKLQDVIGDVTVNNRPALTRFFRPPALAISKAGVEALFETGYEYIISGSCSTNDYKAESLPQLVARIKDGVYTEDGDIKKGAILVMHMIDRAVYTASALDILLTVNEAKADADPSKFRVGRLSDYLTEGYSQSDRQQSLKINRHGMAQSSGSVNNP